jgi:hypothetical protein
VYLLGAKKAYIQLETPKLQGRFLPKKELSSHKETMSLKLVLLQ